MPPAANRLFRALSCAQTAACPRRLSRLRTQNPKMTAGLLGIFLGFIGVHNFYLGYTGKAVAQLVLTIAAILLDCVGIGAFIHPIPAVWGLIEGIMLLCGSINKDGKGNLLKD